MFHELLSRDPRDGSATGSSQGLGPEAYLIVRRRVRGPRTPGFRLVEPTARREGRPYPWLQQVIHEISGLGEGMYQVPARTQISSYFGKKVSGKFTVDRE